MKELADKETSKEVDEKEKSKELADKETSNELDEKKAPKDEDEKETSKDMEEKVLPKDEDEKERSKDLEEKTPKELDDKEMSYVRAAPKKNPSKLSVTVGIALCSGWSRFACPPRFAILGFSDASTDQET